MGSGVTTLREDYVICTHDGQFQADEVLALVMLTIVLKPRGYKVVIKRSRDPEVWKTADILVDVGLEYTHDLPIYNVDKLLEHHDKRIQLRYDHHQHDYKESPRNCHPDGTLFAAAGLVGQCCGLEATKRLLQKSGVEAPDKETTRKTWELTEATFGKRVDVIDNKGCNALSPKEKSVETCLSKRITKLNAIQPDPDESNRRFWEAFKLGEECLKINVCYHYKRITSNDTTKRIAWSVVFDKVYTEGLSSHIRWNIFGHRELKKQLQALVHANITPVVIQNAQKIADAVMNELEPELKRDRVYDSVIGFVSEVESCSTMEEAEEHMKKGMDAMCIRHAYRKSTLETIADEALKKVHNRCVHLGKLIGAVYTTKQRAKNNKDCDYVLSTDPDTGVVQVGVVNPENTPVPIGWIGTKEDVLCKKSGVKDAVFAHTVGFGARSEPSAIAMIDKMNTILSEQQKLDEEFEANFCEDANKYMEERDALRRQSTQLAEAEAQRDREMARLAKVLAGAGALSPVKALPCPPPTTPPPYSSNSSSNSSQHEKRQCEEVSHSTSFFRKPSIQPPLFGGLARKSAEDDNSDSFSSWFCGIFD